MPTWMYQPSTMPKNASVEQKIEILESVIVEMNKRLIWLTSKMDSQNVKRLDTDETVIKSADGRTQIAGPLLMMYDAQTPSVLRLRQGYDAVSTDFLFELYNAAGIQTVGIDSNGDATFAGTITGSSITGGTITGTAISGGTITGGAISGGTITGGAISGGTITGTTITGGTIQTAGSGTRIVITGNMLSTYSAAGTLMGPVWGTGVGANYGDLSFYDDGLETFRIENALGGGGWNLRPMNSGSLVIGYGGTTVLPSGNWNFHSATITNLITNTVAGHSHTVESA